jgi:hypothetical protein
MPGAAHDNPHYIPIADRAEGEPGEGGCLLREAEEREAAASAPDVLELYRAQMRDLPRLVGEMNERLKRGGGGKVGPASVTPELRKPLHKLLREALRRDDWRCFAFSEKRGERVRIGSPWRPELLFNDAGGLVERSNLAYAGEPVSTYQDVLFYRIGAEAPPHGTKAQTVRIAMTTYAKELSAIGSRRGRARFLAPKAGCSESLAYRVLEDEGK